MLEVIGLTTCSVEVYANALVPFHTLLDKKRLPVLIQLSRNIILLHIF
jgi:hypothetical protein